MKLSCGAEALPDAASDGAGAAAGGASDCGAAAFWPQAARASAASAGHVRQPVIAGTADGRGRSRSWTSARPAWEAGVAAATESQRTARAAVRLAGPGAPRRCASGRGRGGPNSSRCRCRRSAPGGRDRTGRCRPPCGGSRALVREGWPVPPMPLRRQRHRRGRIGARAFAGFGRRSSCACRHNRKMRAMRRGWRGAPGLA